MTFALRGAISRRYSTATILAGAFTVASMSFPALAQDSDVCATLDAKVTELGLAQANKLKAANQPVTAADKEYGLRSLTDKPSPYRIEISSDNLPGGGQAWFTITGGKYSEQNSKVCVRLYWRLAKTEPVNRDGTPQKTPKDAPQKEAKDGVSDQTSKAAEPVEQREFHPLDIQQSFRFVDAADNNSAKYKIIFEVPSAGSLGWRIKNGDPFATKREFLLIGMEAPGTKEKEEPKLLSYSTEEKVTAKSSSVIVALIFVAVIYYLLARVTFNEKDAEELTGFRRHVFLVSPIRITAGVFGDSSISQLQVVLFTFIVGGLLMYLWMRTGLLASISTDLLKLLGISAVGAGAAKYVAALKSELDEDVRKYLLAKGWYDWPAVPAAQGANLRNLLLTDGRLDVYKFQVAVFTIVVAAYVVSSGQDDLGDVKISDTMLYLIGISQGVYIGGKTITDRTTRIKDAVNKMIAAEPSIASDPAEKAKYEAAEKVAKAEFRELYRRQPPPVSP